MDAHDRRSHRERLRPGRQDRPPLAGLALAALLLAAPAPAGDADDALRRLLDEDLEAQMRRAPTWASSRGDRRFDALLPDASPEARARWLEGCERRLEAVARIPIDELSPQSRTDARLLRYELEKRLRGARFHPEQTPIDQLRGPHSWLPRLGERLAFTKRKHYEDYVARIRAVPRYLDQVIANMRAGMEAGRTPPRVVMAGAVQQALFVGDERFRQSPESHPMYAPFRERGKDDSLARAAREAIAEAAVPALRELAVFLRDEYAPACREETAASARPEEGYYEWRLADQSTTSLPAEEIHAIGRSEVARIRAEMMEAIARSDFPGREGLEPDELFAAFVEYLRSAPRFYFEDADEMLAAYRDLAKRIDAELPRIIGTLPRLTYGVKPMAGFVARHNTTARYHPGSPETGVPGWFVVNTWKLDQRPTYDMVPLTLHEAVPGHHLQVALAQEMEGVHEWRTLLSYTAYVEGWALYAERLGLEMARSRGPRGLYQDPYDDFGRLNYEMWRALRLVVDTGLHAEGWSRERAIEYMLANSALTKENVRREVDRYIAWPGQAVAYKLGELKIRSLRARAEKALGEGFELRRFHDAVLSEGALPLEVLEARMREWIRAER